MEGKEEMKRKKMIGNLNPTVTPRSEKQGNNRQSLKIFFILQVGVSCPNHHVVDPQKPAHNSV